MGLLSSQAMSAIGAGNRMRQRWTIQVPPVAGSSSYQDNIIHDDADPSKRCIIDAGRRRNTAYNVSIAAPGELSAATYEITADNTSGLFYRGAANGYFSTVWGASTYYADPYECLLKHEIWVDIGGGVWEQLPCSPWVGRIIGVTYHDTFGADGTPRAGTVTITSEGYLGTILRQPWTADHTHEDNYLSAYTPSGMIVTSIDRGWWGGNIWAQCQTTIPCDSTLTYTIYPVGEQVRTTSSATLHQLEAPTSTFIYCSFEWEFVGAGGEHIVVEHPQIELLYQSEPQKPRPW